MNSSIILSSTYIIYFTNESFLHKKSANFANMLTVHDILEFHLRYNNNIFSEKQNNFHVSNERKSPKAYFLFKLNTISDTQKPFLIEVLQILSKIESSSPQVFCDVLQTYVLYFGQLFGCCPLYLPRCSYHLLYKDQQDSGSVTLSHIIIALLITILNGIPNASEAPNRSS